MSTLTIGKLLVECVQGDIVQQPDMDVIVNAANAELMPGGGWPAPFIGPAALGWRRNVLRWHRSAQGRRSSRAHIVCPIGTSFIAWDRSMVANAPADVLLASCYQQALALADDHHVSSIAFPGIFTGAFGYPMEPAAWVALGTVISQAAGLSSVTHVRVVLHAPADLAVHESVLATLIRQRFPGTHM